MKSTSAANAAWCAVATTDPTGLDREAIADFLVSITQVRAICDAAEVFAVRRTRELSIAGTSEPAENLLADKTGRSSRNARQAAEREKACAAMPALETGLADGTVSAGHLDAVAAAHAKLKHDDAEQFASHADELRARAQQIGVDAFERECRDLARHVTALNDRNAEVDELERQKAASSVKRWVDRTTGIHNTLISLDPLRDSKMWKVINNQVAREKQQRTADGEPPLPFTALQAQAVVTVVTVVTMVTTDTPNALPTAGTPTTPSTSDASTVSTPITADIAPKHESPPDNSPTAESPPGNEQRTDTSPTNISLTSIPTTDIRTNDTSQMDPLPSGAHTEIDSSPTAASSAAAFRLPEISILCDLDTLISGIRATGATCETDDGIALPPDTVRRLACDAKIIPILLGTSGEVLDQGRRVRTATPAQRNALAAMHRGCAFPGCTIGFSDSRIHHILWWWEHHGPTDIDNLLPICENHHHFVHEGGWGLFLDADRVATWTRPDGVVHHRGSTINR